MRCINYHGEWTPPPNQSLGKCPFCQADILQMLNAKAEVLSPEVILGNMLQAYGTDLLQNQQRLAAMIADLFSHDHKSKRMLLISVHENIPNQLLAIQQKDTAERSTQLLALQHRLSEEAFLKEEVAEHIVSIWSCAMDYEESDESFQIVWQSGYCGFMNAKNEMITPYKYDNASSFREGLASVALKNKWGFIDKQGNEITPIQYDKVYSFKEGLACVVLHLRHGFIDKQGEEIIPTQYDKTSSFNEELGMATPLKFNGTYTIEEIKAKENVSHIDIVKNPKTGKLFLSIGHKFGAVSTKGIPTKPMISEVSGEDGVAFYLLHEETASANIAINRKFGFIDKQGKEIIPIQYDHAESFSEGLARVSLNNKWGFIDKQGNEIIPIEYEWAESFNEGLGLAKVELNNKWGFIDKQGKEIIPIQYDHAYSFSEGLARVSLNNKWGSIDKQGNWVQDF